MSLTQGSGPLARAPGDSNYTIDAPAHKLLFQPDPRRLRADVGDQTRYNDCRSKWDAKTVR